MQAAEEVSSLLGLDKAVAHMPQGYSTKVGHGAHDSLPRGIKQRIAVVLGLSNYMPKDTVVTLVNAGLGNGVAFGWDGWTMPEVVAFFKQTFS